MPADHALAKRKKISYSLALEHKLAGVHGGGALDRLLTERAATLHSQFAPTFSVSSFDAVCRMVEAGLTNSFAAITETREKPAITMQLPAPALQLLTARTSDRTPGRFPKHRP